jgi:pilus assembly protein Flp/PilA
MLESIQRSLTQLLVRFGYDEQGAALVEYGILVGLIAVICIAAVTIVGTQVSAAFSKIASSLTAAF